MIPLTWFLIAWAIILIPFFFMTLITIGVMFKNGVSCFHTYFLAFGFLAVIVLVFFFTLSQLTTVDWSGSVEFIQSVNIFNA